MNGMLDIDRGKLGWMTPSSFLKLRMLFGAYSGSNNCPNVCMFCTKVNIPSCCLIWALIYECIKWSTYPWLSINPRIKGFEEDLMK